MKKSGFSLALTLWIVAIMSLAAALYLGYAKKVVTKSRQLNSKLEVTFKAESIAEFIKFYGSTGDIKSMSIVNTKLPKYLSTFPKQLFIDSRKKVWDNTTIVLQDTAGLIDIEDIDAVINYVCNQADGLKDKKDIIHDTIADWLDRDSFSTLNGAEDAFYESYGYKARNSGYISSVDELFLLREMNEFNRTTQDKFLSSFVLSNNKQRNILTLSDDMLQSTYNISKSDLLQLKKAKEISSTRFISFFDRIYKENYNFERDGVSPSRIIKVRIISSDKNISKEIEFLIDFSLNNEKAFTILNYKD